MDKDGAARLLKIKGNTASNIRAIMSDLSRRKQQPYKMYILAAAALPHRPRRSIIRRSADYSILLLLLFLSSKPPAPPSITTTPSLHL